MFINIKKIHLCCVTNIYVYGYKCGYNNYLRKASIYKALQAVSNELINRKGK